MWPLNLKILLTLPCLPHRMSQRTWKGHDEYMISLPFRKPLGMCQLLGKVMNHSLTVGGEWEGGQGEKGWGGWCPPVEPPRGTEVLKAHTCGSETFQLSRVFQTHPVKLFSAFRLTLYSRDLTWFVESPDSDLSCYFLQKMANHILGP